LIEVETIGKEEFEELFKQPVPEKKSGTPEPLSIPSSA
jgi:hypothetical protein